MLTQKKCCYFNLDTIGFVDHCSYFNFPLVIVTCTIQEGYNSGMTFLTSIWNGQLWVASTHNTKFCGLH